MDLGRHLLEVAVHVHQALPELREDRRISRWEKGEIEFKVDQILDLERALGVPPGRLLENAGLLPSNWRNTVQRDVTVEASRLLLRLLAQVLDAAGESLGSISEERTNVR